MKVRPFVNQLVQGVLVAAAPSALAMHLLSGCGSDAAVVSDASTSDAPADGAASGNDAATDSTTPGTPATGPFVLFGPNTATSTHLIDLKGSEVHKWTHASKPGQSVMLLDDSRLFRCERVEPNLFEQGGTGGGVAIYDWDGNKQWSYTYATAEHWQHHDAEYMPNGHVLMIAWETKTRAEAIAAGRSAELTNQAGIWADHIIEVDPKTSSIVWEWHEWDHLLDSGAKPSAQPMRIDPNAQAKAATIDWTHFNSIRYNAALDQIAVSVHNLNELFVIDHSTTTAEAKGHTAGKRGRGGDLLYRWGNPANYGGTTTGSTALSGQHDVEWIPDGLSGAGHFLIFDNGFSRSYSRVIEIVQPVQADGSYSFVNNAYGPDSVLWEYKANPQTSFYASHISGSQRLANGNTQITDGPDGRLFEVTPAGATVWEYQIKNKAGMSADTFRSERYESDFVGFKGKTLVAGGPVQFDATSVGGGKDGGTKNDGGGKLDGGPK